MYKEGRRERFGRRLFLAGSYRHKSHGERRFWCDAIGSPRVRDGRKTPFQLPYEADEVSFSGEAESCIGVDVDTAR